MKKEAKTKRSDTSCAYQKVRHGAVYDSITREITRGHQHWVASASLNPTRLKVLRTDARQQK